MNLISEKMDKLMVDTKTIFSIGGCIYSLLFASMFNCAIYREYLANLQRTHNLVRVNNELKIWIMTIVYEDDTIDKS